MAANGFQVNGQAYGTWEEYRHAKLDYLCTKMDLSSTSRAALRQLEGVDIVLVPDDSGSMQTPLGTQQSSGPSYTRWDEQSKVIRHIIDLGSALSRNGISIYFLNKGVLRGITDSSQIESWLAQGPEGGTPLCSTLRAILAEKAPQMEERKLLIVTLTDGQPSGPAGQDESVETLERIMRTERHRNVYNSFVLMTDNKGDIEHVDDIGDKLNQKNFDVTDLYSIELPEVREARGKDYPFSFADYICKMLLGAIDPENFNLDQAKGGSCCSVQ